MNQEPRPGELDQRVKIRIWSDVSPRYGTRFI